MDNGRGEEWNIVDTQARAPVGDSVYNAGRDCSTASSHTAIATRHNNLRYAVGAVKPCHRAPSTLLHWRREPRWRHSARGNEGHRTTDAKTGKLLLGRK